MPQLDESLLDDEERIAHLDSRESLRALATAGAQVREAERLADEGGIAALGRGERPRSVLVASLGGSALVADVLELLAEPGSPVPVRTRHNMPLPGWVGALDLVVAVSHSGRARGPLALAAEAARRGASLLTVGAADSPLADVCARARGIHVNVPTGATSTRTAFWSLVTPVVLAADALGLVGSTRPTLARLADRLDGHAEAFRPSSEAFVNPAKALATDLADGIPVVLGDGPLAGVAARRAAVMLARTARMPVSWGELPDAASQVVALFDGPYTQTWADRQSARNPLDDVFRDPYLDGAPEPRLRLLVLRDAADDSEAGQRRGELADAIMLTARDAGVQVSQSSAVSGSSAGAPRRPRGPRRLHGHLPGPRARPGSGLSPHLADLRDRTG